MASKRDVDYIDTIKRDRVERKPTERSQPGIQLKWQAKKRCKLHHEERWSGERRPNSKVSPVHSIKMASKRDVGYIGWIKKGRVVKEDPARGSSQSLLARFRRRC